jgi:hypothetical protein
MLNFHSGYSKAVNTRKAAVECLKVVGVESIHPPALILVHTTSGHDFQQMISELSVGAPESVIVGCTGSGVIGPDWVSEAMRAMALMVVYGDGIATASISGINGENSQRLSKTCAEDLHSRNPDANMIIAFGPGLNVDGDALVDGIEAVFGPKVPILGGLGGFSGNVPRTPVFHGNRIMDDGLVLVGIADPDLEVVQVQHHGSLPQPERFTVTRSEGLRVDELDGKPAWPTIMASIDLPADTQPTDVITLIGLGLDLDEEDQRDYDNEKILRAPLMLDENGTSCYFQASLPTGTVLTSCQRNEEYLFNGARRLIERLKTRLNGREPLAVLQGDCMARGRLSHNVVEKDGIIREMQQALSADQSLPWLGVYGFAEFGMLNGRNRYHNYTTALSAIVAKGGSP